MEEKSERARKDLYTLNLGPSDHTSSIVTTGFRSKEEGFGDTGGNSRVHQQRTQLLLSLLGRQGDAQAIL